MGKDSSTSQLRRRVQRTARPRPPAAARGATANAANEAAARGATASAAHEGSGAAGLDAAGLWAHVWDCVEGGGVFGGACSSAAASGSYATAKDDATEQIGLDGSHADQSFGRKRIVGKQPPILAIELYRTRLTYKQPPPFAFLVHQGRSSLGHYDTLGVQRTATPAQIHAAYRRRALATHPDKGGSPEDFRRVVAAFEELADPSRRAAYDRRLTMFGRSDGGSADTSSGLASWSEDAQTANKKRPMEPQDAQSYFAQARVALASLLLVSGEATWSTALAELPELSLEALKHLLQGSASAMPPREPDPAAAEASGGSKAGGGGQMPSCISQHKSGYKVTLAWSTLQVCTDYTKCLDQAIDWQIALQWMRNLAEARMKRHRNAKPLTQEELIMVLNAEPTLELTFTVFVTAGGGKGKRISAPPVQDLALALEFNELFSAALVTGMPALQKAKREAGKEALQSKKILKARRQKLLVQVTKEIHSRFGPSRSTTAADESVQQASKKSKCNENAERSAKPMPPDQESRMVLWRPSLRINGKTPPDFCCWSYW
eukprot:TRINITY_DN4985_c0_g1_i1.p1 TRINITY_DN4985_c0_g1~~TRINITY_DN4985_c0_g1_i1.p1  ORF type:complete len:584 (-),score=136.06 TRINITY_DN4985_c0_g1_i1:46-1689(-)